MTIGTPVPTFGYLHPQPSDSTMARPIIELPNYDIRDLNEAAHNPRTSQSFKAFLSTLHFNAGYAVMKTATKAQQHMRELAEIERQLDRELKTRPVEVAMTENGRPVLDAAGKPRTVFMYDFASAEEQREYERRVNDVMAAVADLEVHTFDPKYLPDGPAHPDFMQFDICWLNHESSGSNGRAKKATAKET